VIPFSSKGIIFLTDNIKICVKVICVDVLTGLILEIPSIMFVIPFIDQIVPQVFCILTHINYSSNTFWCSGGGDEHKTVLEL
jgi:hypothetical protein